MSFIIGVNRVGPVCWVDYGNDIRNDVDSEVGIIPFLSA